MAWGVADFPLAWPALAAGLVGYAAAVWVFPRAWLWVVPAALPALNLAPWSGRFFWDETDLLLGATLAVLLARGLPKASRGQRWSAVGIAAAALGLSYAVSLGQGLFPLPPLDLNRFAAYESPYNGLRVAKGVAWALVLTPFVPRDGDAVRRFLGGTTVGLAAVVAVALWERAVFPGLWDFAADFRITSTFSSMHVGGGAVEAYLVLSTLLSLAWAGAAGTPWARAPVAVLLPVALYAMVATQARGGFAALAGALAVWAALTVHPRRRLAWAVVAMGLVCALAVGLGAVTGRLTERFAASRQDLSARLAHWRGALALRTDDPWSRAVGMGVGSFPRLYRQATPPLRRAGDHSFLSVGDEAFVRLAGGGGAYLGQRVPRSIEGYYELGLRVRASEGRGAAMVYLCEKSLLYSFECTAQAVPVSPGVAS